MGPWNDVQRVPGGLVAITAPCAFVTPIGAALIGVVAGILVVYSSIIVEKMGVDDVAGAISVHGTCGAWGVLSVGYSPAANTAQATTVLPRLLSDSSMAADSVNCSCKSSTCRS